MENIIFGDGFYSIEIKKAEELFTHIKDRYEYRSGKYKVLQSRELDEEDASLFASYLGILIGLGIVDSVLDEKIMKGNSNDTLYHKIEMLKDDITGMLGRYDFPN